MNSVAYPGGCIACACTPEGLRGAPKRRGEKERSKERERKKRERKGRINGSRGVKGVGNGALKRSIEMGAKKKHRR